MSPELPVLDQVSIARPCTAAWNKMKGDDRIRFCGECGMDVYNFSGMTREEVVQLVSKKEGRMCGRFFRRADGKMLTDDCPVGLKAARRKLARCVGRFAAFVVFLGGLFGVMRHVSADAGAGSPIADLKPFALIQSWLDPSAGNNAVIMGEVSVTPPPGPTTSNEIPTASGGASPRLP